MQRLRVANDETFINRIFHLILEVGIFHHSHFIDESLVLHIFVVSLSCSNAVALVSQYLYSCFHSLIIEHRHKVGTQFLIKDRIAALAIHNLSTIISQNISAIFSKLQLFSQRHNAVGRSARSQHHHDTFLLSFHQRLVGARSNLFLTIC